jgi:hypothetical protein
MPTHTFITTRGFRKWYERELIRGHSHLVLLVLCMLAVLGAFEAMRDLGGAQRWASMAVAVLVAGAVGVWALRRYLFLLLRAERVANQAVCPRCGTYARWRIVGHELHDEDESLPSHLQVHCRACEHEWGIDW